jgi:DNA polymerase-3 subunit gamma/tau
MLGTIDRDHVMRLLRLLAAGDAKGMIGAIREIDEQFPDYARLLDDFARDLQRVAVFQVVGSFDGEDDLSDQEVAELAETMSIADVQLYYQIAVIGRRDLHLAPDPRSGAEMTLLRMLAFRPAATEAGSVSGGGGAIAGTASKIESPKVVQAKVVQSNAQGHKWTDPDWPQLVSDLGLSGAVRLLASNCAFIRREGNTVYLGLDPRSESMLTTQRKSLIGQKLTDRFGEELAVDITIGSAVDETPVQQESRMADEKLEEARQTLEADPNVQTLKNMFGAELKPDTIEIISGEKG